MRAHYNPGGGRRQSAVNGCHLHVGVIVNFAIITWPACRAKNEKRTNEDARQRRRRQWSIRLREGIPMRSACGKTLPLNRRCFAERESCVCVRERIACGLMRDVKRCTHVPGQQCLITMVMITPYISLGGGGELQPGMHACSPTHRTHTQWAQWRILRQQIQRKEPGRPGLLHGRTKTKTNIATNATAHAHLFAK